MLKKILTMALAVIMMLSLTLCLFACNDDDKDKENGDKENGGSVTYTVTVLDDQGNPVAGAQIFFTETDGLSVPYPTDENGVASFPSEKKVSASVLAVPEGYEYDKLTVTQSFDKDGKLSITVKKAAAPTGDPYVITVVDDEGNPIAGVPVQMCNKVSGICIPGGTTDENGQFSYTYREGEFRAQITSGKIPEGYTVEGDPEAYYEFENNKVTITLNKTEK